MKITEKKCRRRLESPRGTVMLEFALIMPVLLMIGMFVIEILQYHDAQLMADHAAWRLARIAAVRTSGKDGKVTFPKWKSIGSEQLAVALLMSTATTGWSGKGNELLASKVASLFGGESSQTGKIAGTIIGQLGVASMLESFFSRQFSGSRSGRMLLQLGMAGERVIEKDVIEVSTESIGKLEYPVISTDKKKIPEKVDAHLIQVKVDYPMRGGWLYEYFALDSKLGERRPRVHGRAVMLADRRIEDTSVYAASETNIPSDFAVILSLFKDKIFSYKKW